MKNLASFGKRGFTLIETVLVLAIGLGLIIGGIVFYQQAQASSDLTDKTRAAVGIASEIRAQFRNEVDYSSLDQAVVQSRASIPDSQWSNLAVQGMGQDFILTFTSLNSRVCNRMAASDLGPGAEPDDMLCDIGTLSITYTRGNGIALPPFEPPPG